jgi:hypothetical protein
MKLDYWHQRRYFHAEGIDEDLPFGEPPFVIGPLVAMAEPVWQSLRATVLAADPGRHLPEWTWRAPLSADEAASLANRLDDVAGQVESTGQIVVAANIADGLEPDTGVVLRALRVLPLLLRLAAERGTSVQTWVE